MAKINLKQVLAAFALAFALGVVAVPSNTFAAGENTGTQVSDASYVATAQDVVNMIKAVRGADTGNKYANLHAAIKAAEENPDGSFNTLVEAIAAFSTDKNKIEPNVDDYDTVDAWKSYAAQYVPNYTVWMNALSTIDAIYKDTETTSSTSDADLITAINAKPATSRQSWYNSLANFYYVSIGTTASNIIELNKRINSELTDYPKMAALVAGVEAFNKADITGAELDTAKANLSSALEAVLPEDETVPTEVDAMIAKAKTVTDYNKYAALYDSLGFIRTLTSNGSSALTEAMVNTLNTNAQASKYTAMRTAAVALKPNIAHNLMGASTLPDTGAGDNDNDNDNSGNGDKTDVTTPDTGIVGMIESGALDLGTVTLIASVVVASIAGLGLIAKLYLKHKF